LSEQLEAYIVGAAREQVELNLSLKKTVVIIAIDRPARGWGLF